MLIAACQKNTKYLKKNYSLKMVRPLEAKYKEKRDSSRLLHNAVHN